MAGPAELAAASGRPDGPDFNLASGVEAKQESEIVEEHSQLIGGDGWHALQTSFHWGGDLAGRWEAMYPAAVKLWENAWADFVPFLSFDGEIRAVIYTASAIESINARIRRAVKTRGHFPNEQAALKRVYLAVMSLDPQARAVNAGRTAGSRH